MRKQVSSTYLGDISKSTTSNSARQNVGIVYCLCFLRVNLQNFFCYFFCFDADNVMWYSSVFQSF